jgi:hypothetical protein
MDNIADISIHTVHFQDESRDIASEYAGGVKRYAPFINTATPVRTKNSPPTPRNNPSVSSMGSSATLSHPTLPPILPLLPDPPRLNSNNEPAVPHEDSTSHHHHQSTSAYSGYALSSSSSRPPPRAPTSDRTLSPAPRETKSYLENAEETLFMQVFVEEVGIWMDSLDPLKHVSFQVPCHHILANLKCAVLSLAPVRFS